MGILFKKNSINKYGSEKKASFRTELINSVREGDKSLFKEFYLKEKSPFVKWGVKKYAIDETDLNDIYQEVMAVFYENITSGKLKEFTSAPTTYIYGIGKNIILSKLKKEDKVKNSSNELNIELSFLANGQDQDLSEELEKLTSKVKVLFENMGEPCYSILKYFYFENLAIKNITSLMKYKNDSVVKNQKKRCIDRLKKELI